MRNFYPTDGMQNRSRDRLGELAERVNILDLLRAQAGISTRNIDLGAAREVSDELAKQSGRNPNGFFVHHRTFAASRGLTVGTPTAGGHTVATNLLASSFIDLLRPRSRVLQAGARVMNGLTGNVALPRQTGASTAYWIAEDESPAASMQAFDQVQMTPKTIGAYTDISRKLLLQSSISMADFVSRDLVTTIAMAVDAAAINGSGGAQPTGLLATSGVQSQSIAGAKPTWAEIVAAGIKVVSENNESASAAFVLTSKQRADLMKTEKSTGSGVYIWEPSLTSDSDGHIGGWRGYVTNNLPQALGAGSNEHAAIVGIWSDLILGMWSAVDLQVDPFTHSTSGALRVTAFQDVDVAVRHPESFCALQWAPTT